ncbi:MAG TPA: carbon-nitrogen hydrolase family protein [Alphaproteobacteria bacterium]|nr:carbon-nitrogen hydrolase family protein [Alphaproteobacteria bacterium]MCB9985271.1 carbon-nitrogen hydrolase family protein [Micavibrio sp.]HPQ50502.1 carbon-nitrogen hydrolase family protein [Alphaproteobacteria bacterium]HRK98230.1 carbon-nitrogen hydrolase family protein [Alphaproteobacteria bacterium]
MTMKVAVLQMTSGSDMAVNIIAFESMVRDAAAAGAYLIASPENSDLMGLDVTEKVARVCLETDHPMISLCESLAQELGVWISLGSIAIKASAQKFYNRSYLFSPAGKVVASYNKIHLFDVDLPSGEIRRESKGVEAGDQMVVAHTDFSDVGLSICYDVRFPQIYRKMAQAGAGVLFIPAAFTVSTGQMHWEVLLRARAIENGAFVIAAAQCGDHGHDRKTYGHAMIVNPWGEILAEAGEVPEIIYANLDLDEVRRARGAIASLTHDRDF